MEGEPFDQTMFSLLKHLELQHLNSLLHEKALRLSKTIPPSVYSRDKSSQAFPPLFLHTVPDQKLDGGKGLGSEATNIPFFDLPFYQCGYYRCRDCPELVGTVTPEGRSPLT